MFFSSDKTATIAHVLPIMDRIDDLLAGTTSVPTIIGGETVNQPLAPAVKYALTFARASINKYYSKTDMSNVYRIALCK